MFVTLSWPPTSQTVKSMFLYSTVSTLNPIVGMVVTTSPSFSLYNIVVLPAASKPTIRIRFSFLPASLSSSFPNNTPILWCCVCSAYLVLCVLRLRSLCCGYDDILTHFCGSARQPYFLFSNEAFFELSVWFKKQNRR